MTQLDALTAKLDSETLGRLGDPITYTRAAGGPALSINGFVDHRDSVEGLVGGSTVTADVDIRVRVVDVAQPARDDRIFLPRRNETRIVTNWLLDASGSFWSLDTAVVAG